MFSFPYLKYKTNFPNRNIVIITKALIKPNWTKYKSLKLSFFFVFFQPKEIFLFISFSIAHGNYTNSQIKFFRKEKSFCKIKWSFYIKKKRQNLKTNERNWEFLVKTISYIHSETSLLLSQIIYVLKLCVIFLSVSEKRAFYFYICYWKIIFLVKIIDEYLFIIRNIRELFQNNIFFNNKFISFSKNLKLKNYLQKFKI